MDGLWEMVDFVHENDPKLDFMSAALLDDYHCHSAGPCKLLYHAAMPITPERWKLASVFLVLLHSGLKHTTSRSSTSIAGLLGFFVTSLAKIISSGVNNDGTL